jgi:hypothetical protein
LPRISFADAMVIHFGVKIKCGSVKSLFESKTLKRHKMDHLLSSSKRQAA